MQGDERVSGIGVGMARCAKHLVNRPIFRSGESIQRMLGSLGGGRRYGARKQCDKDDRENGQFQTGSMGPKLMNDTHAAPHVGIPVYVPGNTRLLTMWQKSCATDDAMKDGVLSSGRRASGSSA